jgi:hypothetical protein
MTGASDAGKLREIEKKMNINADKKTLNRTTWADKKNKII